MSKIIKPINKDRCKGTEFLNSFIEFEDEAMQNCRLLNEVFLEIRLEISMERREKNILINKTLF